MYVGPRARKSFKTNASPTWHLVAHISPCVILGSGEFICRYVRIQNSYSQFYIYPKPLISSFEPESILHAYIHLHVWYVVCSIPILIVLSAIVELWYTLFRLTFCMLILKQGFLTFSYREMSQNLGLMPKSTFQWGEKRIIFHRCTRYRFHYNSKVSTINFSSIFLIRDCHNP